MANNDEVLQAECLELYRSQLHQVEDSLAACSDESTTRDDLLQLQTDLRELIALTEESLLNIKKQKLLESLGGINSSVSSTDVDNSLSDCHGSTELENFMDDEFAEFQKEIAACSAGTVEMKRGGDGLDSVGTSSKNVNKTNELSEQFVANGNESNKDIDKDDIDDDYDDAEEDDNDEDSVDDVSGTKCRVLHSHSWGEMTEHNAMVVCQEPEADGKKMIRVIFCNPTHKSLVPCPFYMEGRCRFSDADCRYSHGEVIAVDEVRPFKDPDFSEVHIGSRCLAKDMDSVWYPGVVVEILPNYKFKVQYDANSAVTTVDIQNIIPVESPDDDGNDSDQSDEQNSVLNDSETIPEDSEDFDIPVYLWKEGRTTELLGEWEKYTKGIGSKLMAKMGYVVGQGLGRNSEGRAEPVPIELLPQGKSLDKIMELRSMAADKDLFNALKKQKRLQKKVDKDAEKSANQLHKQMENKSNMFDFINKKLNSNRGKTKSAKYEKNLIVQNKNISISDLKSKSDKHVNIQLVKTQEEIKKSRIELQKLRNSFTRNEKQDQGVAKQLSGKISSLNEYIRTLEASMGFLQQEVLNRKAHNSLTKF